MKDSEQSDGLNTQIDRNMLERKIAALTAINSALTVENEDLRSQVEAQLEAQLDVADGETAAAELKELQEEFAKRLGTADRNNAELRDERDRLRTEVSTLKASRSQAEKRATDLEDKVKDLKAELDRLNEDSRQRDSDAHRLRNESHAVSAELSTCKQRIQTLEASLNEAQERLLVASADAGSREQELEAELQDLQDRTREEVKQAKLRAQAAQEALEAALEEKEVLAHAAAQHDELLEQLTSLRISLSQAQADIAAKEDELIESRACLDRAVRKQDETRATDSVNTELLSQIERLTQSLAQAQDDGAQALAELQSKYVAARRSLEEAEESTEELEAEVQRLKGDIAARTQQSAAAEAHTKQLEQQVSDLQQQAAAAEQCAQGVRRAGEEAAASSRHKMAELQSELDQTTQLLSRTEALLAQAQADRDMLKTHLAGLHPLPHPGPPGTGTPSLAALGAAPSDSEIPLDPPPLGGGVAAAVFSSAAAPPGVQVPGGVSQSTPLEPGQRTDGTAIPRTSSAAHFKEFRSLRHSRTGSVADGEWGGIPLSRNLSGIDMVDLWNNGAKKSIPGANASKLDSAVVEGLQAQFKTVEAERDALHSQLLQAFNAESALAEKEAEVAAATSEQRRLQAHLDIATEMIGEQNARISELEEDIADMTAIFHDQLEEAMAQLVAAKAQMDQQKHQNNQPTSTKEPTLIVEEDLQLSTN